MLANAVGLPVKGEDFFDRTRERAELWSRLATDNVLLLAPRRVGKTSLMFRLRDEAESHGFTAVYLSVADVASERALVERIHATLVELDPARRALGKVTRGPLARLVRRIKKLGVPGASIELSDGGADQWAQLGEAIARALCGVERRWLLLIDELPIFVLSLLRQDPKGERARFFLNWFRQLRQDSHGAGSVRWVLAGSIGLDAITRRMRLGDTINDLFLFSDFGPFTRESADAFLDELAAGYGLALDRRTKDALYDRIGWLIPYHLQLFFAELRSVSREVAAPATPAMVDRVFEALLAPSRRAYFDYWSQRLREELGPRDARYAHEILGAAALEARGASRQVLSGVLSTQIAKAEQRDEKLSFLLDVLENDGYLVRNGDRFAFRSSLLREFWIRHVSP